MACLSGKRLHTICDRERTLLPPAAAAAASAGRTGYRHRLRRAAQSCDHTQHTRAHSNIPMTIYFQGTHAPSALYSVGHSAAEVAHLVALEALELLVADGTLGLQSERRRRAVPAHTQ